VERIEMIGASGAASSAGGLPLAGLVGQKEFRSIHVGMTTHLIAEPTSEPRTAADAESGFGGAWLSWLAGHLSMIRPWRGALLTGLAWTADPGPGPVAGGEQVYVDCTVTRIRLAVEPARESRVHQAAAFTASAGAQIGRAELRWLIPGSAGCGADVDHVHLDLGSPMWAKLIEAVLNRDELFRSATGTFDGSIGIASGDEAVEFRIYRGSIIETSRKTLNGPTFTVLGSELAWVNLMKAPRNDYVLRAQAGDFSIAGSAYQYLRLLKAVVRLVDQARLLAEIKNA
jgi:hypothetical protein